MTGIGPLNPGTRRKNMYTEGRRKELFVGSTSILFLVSCIFVAGMIVYIYEFLKNVSFIGSEDLSISRGALRGAWVSIDSQPFNMKETASQAKHLIIVAGHSVTISGHLYDAGEDESDWFLLDYQRGQGLPQAIKGHIQAGIKEANDDPESLLVFSGGETRSVTGPLSEGSSYFHVADAMKLWPPGGSVRARTVTEEFATDSFENFMFSICRFKEVTGEYPTKISIVSFTFKERRFTQLHAVALAWPQEKLKYIGVDPPSWTGFDLQRSAEGEQENAAAPFNNDPYGCH